MENVYFDVRCNKLEEWLIERNYNPIVVKKPILKARAFSRDTLLDKNKEDKNNDRFILFHTYMLLTPNKEHSKVFRDNIPMIGWKKPK